MVLLMIAGVVGFLISTGVFCRLAPSALDAVTQRGPRSRRFHETQDRVPRAT